MARALEALQSGDKSTTKNNAFKPTHYSLTAVEDKRIQKIREKMGDTKKKIKEYKIMMERVLIKEEQFKQNILMLEKEKAIKL